MITSSFHSSIEFAQLLMATEEVAQRKQLLSDYPDLIDDDAAEQIKQAAEKSIHSNLRRANELVELLEMVAQTSGQQYQCALALLAKGNLHNIGMADYPLAIEVYNRAIAIFTAIGSQLGVARVKMGRMWAFCCLGHFDDAFADGDDCLDVLGSLAQWRLLTVAMINLAAVHQRNGNDELSLQWLENARITITSHLTAEVELLSWIEQNQALSLRNMGRFEESCQIAISAMQHLQACGQGIEAARAQQNLAMTYFLMGRYTEALANLDASYTAFVNDQRWANALVVELYKTDCLLQLRRFDEVIEICNRVQGQFSELGVEQLVGEVLVNSASAYMQRREYEQAITALQEAMKIFEQLSQPLWIAIVQLDLAQLYNLTSNPAGAIDLACEAAVQFQCKQHLSKEADAWLVAASSAMQCNRLHDAQQWINEAFEIGERNLIPFAIFQCYKLYGQLYEGLGNAEEAIRAYDHAVRELEKLRSTLMIEYRPDFVAGKDAIYGSLVRLLIVQGRAEEALYYAERAKSRALVELLDRQLDLKIQAKHPDDKQLVWELQQLRQKRDLLQNRLLNAQLSTLREQTIDSTQSTYTQLLEVEQKITTEWHRLLTHNADYARQTDFVMVDVQSFREYLPKNHTLLEYFVVEDKLVAFCVNSCSVTVCQLPVPWHEIQKQLQKWQLSIQTVMQNPAKRAPGLLENARGILYQLYKSTFEPIEAHIHTERLIVVPHGSLHYAPFHAFYDRTNYLIEKYEISYLPAAGLLRLIRSSESQNHQAFVYGNSGHGRLPSIISEVNAVAEMMHVLPFVDNDLTKAALLDAMQHASIIHLSTHGQFHPENPLFSGLQLNDGWLTTLDVYNLQLDASLITLSGCNTGRHHILGGDEVSGLMRAFLSAGARSLILSLWPVDDNISAWLMTCFYEYLGQNYNKGLALQKVQLRCIRGELPTQFDPSVMAHPFFWAPFFWVGRPS